MGGSFGRGGSVYKINPPQSERRPDQEEANPEPETTREDLTVAGNRATVQGHRVLGNGPSVQGQGLLQDILNLVPKPPPLPAINLPAVDLPDLNVEFPDINLNTDLGIVNFKANLRRQQNRQGVPGASGGSVEGQGSFEEVLKHRPDEDQEKEDENERPSDR